LFQAWQIIEWIEFNKLLGVSHFYLYDQSIAKNVTCVLKEYALRGMVTLLDWDGSPYRSTAKNNEIRAYNMFAAFNDCLYRGMYKHKYLAFYDVDEYFMPKKHKDLIALMEDMERQDKNMASLTFRNTFFYTQWPDDPNANNSHLVTMRKTRRKVDFHRVNERSKYICKPEEVLEVGNHFVWETRTSQMKQVTLGLDVGFLHHYRSSCESGNTCLNLKSEIDTSMWKWKNQLTKAVTSLQQSIGKKCELTPI